MNRADQVLRAFYRTPRAGTQRLSDGGGPFGFDIHTALQVDYLIKAYGCDGIVESGTHYGDTTEYLARMYPDLPVRTCEINTRYAAVAAYRHHHRPTVTVNVGDSATLLPAMLEGFQRPLVYLDAHWEARWPLASELRAVTHGVIAIDDFDIAHPRFSFDHYDTVVCGPDLIRTNLPDITMIHVGNPLAAYPLPCLQVGRRSGTGYVLRGLAHGPIDACPMFEPIQLRPHLVMPDWSAQEPKPALAHAGAPR